MSDGYNFQQLKEAILPLSEATVWEVAKNEWKLSSITQADEPETCPCGHYPIIDLCEIINKINGNRIDVGNICVKRFLGVRSDLIFASLKRIQNDLLKSVGAEAATFFYEKGAINSWEYSFVQSNLRKRNLTFSQMSKRQQINEKILASVRRRGIS